MSGILRDAFENLIKGPDGKWVPQEGTKDGVAKVIPANEDGSTDLSGKDIKELLEELLIVARISLLHQEFVTKESFTEDDLE